MRILLTGGSGFIGKHVLISLLNNQHNVISVSRQGISLPDTPDRGNHIALQGCFYEKNMLDSYHQYQPEAIVHLAAVRGAGKGRHQDYQTVNSDGTEKLVHYAVSHRLRLFIYFSTVGVYGTIPAECPAGIQTPVQPDNPYHRSKYQGEVILQETTGGSVPYVIIRPTITYGRGDDGFLSKLVDLIRKRMFPLVRQEINIHLLNVATITDTVNMILAGERLHQRVILLADRFPVKLQDVVNRIHRYFFDRPYPEYLKVSPVFYRWAEKLTRAGRFEGWNASFRLLSNSWWFKTEESEFASMLAASDTWDGIDRYLKTEYPKYETAAHQ